MSLPATFDLTPEDAQLLLASNAHLGARNVQVCTRSHMTLYPWTVISVKKTASPSLSCFEIADSDTNFEEFLDNLNEFPTDV